MHYNGELLWTEFRITEEFIEQKTCVKYLGIQIDNQLKRKEHVASVSLKVSRAIGMIKHAKQFLLTANFKIALSRTGWTALKALLFCLGQLRG